MREEIYLTRENKIGDVVGLTAFYINGLEKLNEFLNWSYRKDRKFYRASILSEALCAGNWCFFVP